MRVYACVSVFNLVRAFVRASERAYSQLLTTVVSEYIGIRIYTDIRIYGNPYIQGYGYPSMHMDTTE